MKAVFLIHGFLTGKDDFTPLYKPLEELYDKVYLFNIPGHAEKNLIEFKTKITIHNLLSEFDKLQSEYDCIDVIGFSLGGTLATFLANKREFNKLVLISPANKYLNFKMPIFRGKFYYSQFKAYLNSENKISISDIFKDELEILKITANNILTKDLIMAVNNFLLLVDKVNQNFKKIDNEVIILWGEMDELVPKSSIGYIFSKCKNEKRSIHVIKNIGHLMLYSVHHQIIIDLIMKFLNE